MRTATTCKSLNDCTMVIKKDRKALQLGSKGSNSDVVCWEKWKNKKIMLSKGF